MCAVGFEPNPHHTKILSGKKKTQTQFAVSVVTLVKIKSNLLLISLPGVAQVKTFRRKEGKCYKLFTKLNICSVFLPAAKRQVMGWRRFMLLLFILFLFLGLLLFFALLTPDWIF